MEEKKNTVPDISEKQELALWLANKINFYDKLLFKKTLPISVQKEGYDPDTRSVAAFRSEDSFFFRLLGFRGEYFVFGEHLDMLYDQREYVESIAIHEVRHRFQCENKKCIITEEYVMSLQQDYPEFAWLVMNRFGDKYYPKGHPARHLEIDATFIQILTYYNIKNLEIVKEILTGNQQTIQNHFSTIPARQ
jgi:hypothetical protein